MRHNSHGAPTWSGVAHPATLDAWENEGSKKAVFIALVVASNIHKGVAVRKSVKCHESIPLNLLLSRHCHT